MKLNERFSREEIIHFDKKIVEMILDSHNDWLSQIKKLSKLHLYGVIKYLELNHKFHEKTAHRFINYLILSPWYRIYTARRYDRFKIECSSRLLQKTLESISYTVGSSILSRNAIMRKDPSLLISQEVIFSNIELGLLVRDGAGELWPIELLK